MSNTYKGLTGGANDVPPEDRPALLATRRLPRAELPPVGPAPPMEPAAETVRAPIAARVEDVGFDEHEATTKDRCPACMGKGWLPPDIALQVDDALRQASERQR